MHWLALRAFLQTEMISFRTLLYTSASKSPLFYIPEGFPFGRSLPVWAILGIPPPRVRFKNMSTINLEWPSNIHKETGKMLHCRLIMPMKANQLPSYRSSKNIVQ